MPEPVSDMNRNLDAEYYSDGQHFLGNYNEESLDINLRNLQSLSLLDNFRSMPKLTALDNNENCAYFQDFDSVLSPFMDDPKEGNISRTVRVPTSEHVAEIVGRQGCKIKDLRARTNTYIKTPMRTQSPVFVVTGKEEAVHHVIAEIQSAAEHFTHIRASRNHHKSGAGLDMNKPPVSREGDVMIQVTVPYRVVGLVVGLKGQTIKAVQQETDTFIVTPNRDKAPIFEIRGQPENAERAKMMILRHIDTRTGNCRLQDLISLPDICSIDQRRGGSDLSYLHTEALTQNSHCSSSFSDHRSSSCDSVLNGCEFGSHGSCASSTISSISPPANDRYSLRGYNSLLHQSPLQNGHSAAWSSATADSTPMFDIPLPYNFTTNPASSSHGFQYRTSGAASSNSSLSMSPPHDLYENSVSHQQLPNYCTISKSSSPVRFMNDGTSLFTRCPVLPDAVIFSSRRSLVLDNLPKSASCGSSHIRRNVIGSRDILVTGVSDRPEDKHELLDSVAATLSGTSLTDFPRTITGDAGLFTAFPNDDSCWRSKCRSQGQTTAGSQKCSRLCQICQQADVVAALVPCGHNLFCMECAENIVNKSSESDRKCPVCKDTAADVLRIRG